MYLLDTNVLSEVRRRDGHPGVHAWFSAVGSTDLYLSVLILGEIRRGIVMVTDKDPSLAAALEDWLAHLRIDYADRLLPIDNEVAMEWGRLSAARTVPVVDCLLAATARHHHLTLVTRNIDDLDGLDVDVLNPFDDA